MSQELRNSYSAQQKFSSLTANFNNSGHRPFDITYADSQQVIDYNVNIVIPEKIERRKTQMQTKPTEYLQAIEDLAIRNKEFDNATEELERQILATREKRNGTLLRRAAAGMAALPIKVVQGLAVGTVATVKQDSISGDTDPIYELLLAPLFVPLEILARVSTFVLVSVAGMFMPSVAERQILRAITPTGQETFLDAKDRRDEQQLKTNEIRESLTVLHDEVMDNKDFFDRRNTFINQTVEELMSDRENLKKGDAGTVKRYLEEHRDLHPFPTRKAPNLSLERSPSRGRGYDFN